MTILTSPRARSTIRKAALTIMGSTTDGRRNLVIAIPLPGRVVDLGRSRQAQIEAQEPLEEVRAPGKAQADSPYGHHAHDRGPVPAAPVLTVSFPHPNVVTLMLSHVWARQNVICPSSDVCLARATHVSWPA